MFRFLVVDDNPVDAAVLRSEGAASSREYEVDWVQDGAEALDFLHRRGAFTQAKRPDVVLMDLNMPRLGGLEALRAIKGDANLRAIPVVMLTNRAGPLEVRACYEAHANAYVQKPASLEEARKLFEALARFWMDWVVPAAENGIFFQTLTNGATFSTDLGLVQGIVPKGDGFNGREIAVKEAEAERVATKERSAETVGGEPACEEHRRLLGALGGAVHELLKLHEEQFLAIVQGEIDSSRFDLLIHMANEAKQQAKYAYMEHVESHGCSDATCL